MRIVWLDEECDAWMWIFAGNRHEIVAVIKGREGEVVSGFGEDEISESRSLILKINARWPDTFLI